MTQLYITADKVGMQSGGGTVTLYESLALQEYGNAIVWGREQLPGGGQDDPWGWDEVALKKLSFVTNPPSLAHFYAGTFSKTVAELKKVGCRVTYTAAAHNVNKSRTEHRRLGIPFDYPHLNEPELWKRYVGGYLAADVLICPSKHSADVMRSFGANKRIEIIPHGVDVPEKVTLPPQDKFVLGYLGAVGPDKGLIYLLQAWKKLDYKKDAFLVIAGRDSISAFMYDLISKFGGGSIVLAGWQENVSDFYNSLSCYCQPSVSEGFGCEVLEAASHSRVALCSDGAGAADVVPIEWRFPSCDVDALACLIDRAKNSWDLVAEGLKGRDVSKLYTWNTIRKKYVDLWEKLS